MSADLSRSQHDARPVGQSAQAAGEAARPQAPGYGFLHIPKTAGTSVRALLDRHFGTGIELIEQGAFLNRFEQLQHVPCVTGHLAAFLFDLEEPRRKVFTMLREPVDRVKSYINYVTSYPHHPGYARYASGQVTIPDFFVAPPYKAEIVNLQTRMLGVDVAVPGSRPVQELDATEKTRLLTAFWETPVTPSVLERAKARLKSSIEPTVVEFMDFSVVHTMRGIIGAAAFKTVPRVNVSAAHHAFDEGIIGRIRHVNQLDAELYAFAEGIFLNRAAAWIASRGEIVDLAGGPWAFSGLYPVERIKEETFRWTNGGASLRVMLPHYATGVRATIEIWKGPSSDNLHIDASGRAARKIGETERSTRYQTDAIPFAASGPNEVVLRIESGTSRVPDDVRTLGVCLRSIKLEVLNRPAS